MALADVQLKAVPGDTRLIVDGADISSEVAAVSIRAEGHQIPQMFIEMRVGAVDLSGQYEVYKVEEGTPLLDFLEAIDAEQLDIAVQAQLQLDPKPYHELVMDVLLAWARGN